MTHKIEVVDWKTESDDEAHHREIARHVGISFERLMELRRNFMEAVVVYDPRKGL